MTTRRAARPLTKAQQAKSDRIEAAPAAEESYVPGADSPPDGPEPPPATDDTPEPQQAAQGPLGEESVVPAGTLAVRPTQQDWTPAQLAALGAMSFKRDKPGYGELQVFLNYAQRTGLDPFARQIYMIARWNSKAQALDWTIQTGIDGMRVVAQRSGEYAGQTSPQWCGPDGEWKDVWLGAGPPSAARVGIHRRGFAEPLYAVARFASYAPAAGPGSMMWDKMPDVMISKVAEALGLRKAFPHDLSGIYVNEEMHQADVVQSSVIESSTTEQPTDPPATPADPEAVAGEIRAAMMLAASGDHKGLSAQWKLVRQANLSAEPIEWNGTTGTLGDLIVWLGSNIQRGAKEAADTWLQENPEPGTEDEAEVVAEVVADLVASVVSEELPYVEPVDPTDPWAVKS